MKNVLKRTVFLGVIIFLGYSVANAYEEVDVETGATMTGTVTFKGAVPSPKTFELAKFPQPEFCGQVDSDEKGNRLLEEVSVKDGKLKDVIIFVKGVKKGKPMNFNETDVIADKCRFLVQGGPSTFVGVVVNKGKIRIKNMDADPNDPRSVDGVLHNPHTYEVLGTSTSTIFNLPLPNKGSVIQKRIKLRRAKKGSFMKLECDQHNYMNAWFHPVDNPYYAIVGEDGNFTIDRVPFGTFEVYAWHPVLGEMKRKVTFAIGVKQTVDFTFEAK